MCRLPAVVLALALVIPAAGSQPAGKAEAVEVARLKGTWKVVRLQVGKKVSELLALEWTLAFDGDRWTMKQPDGNRWTMKQPDGTGGGRAAEPAVRRLHPRLLGTGLHPQLGEAVARRVEVRLLIAV
jgi:hypothetical protein